SCRGADKEDQEQKHDVDHWRHGLVAAIIPPATEAGDLHEITPPARQRRFWSPRYAGTPAGSARHVRRRHSDLLESVLRSPRYAAWYLRRSGTRSPAGPPDGSSGTSSRPRGRRPSVDVEAQNPG